MATPSLHHRSWLATTCIFLIGSAFLPKTPAVTFSDVVNVPGLAQHIDEAAGLGNRDYVPLPVALGLSRNMRAPGWSNGLPQTLLTNPSLDRVAEEIRAKRWSIKWSDMPASLQTEPKIVLAAIDRKWITTWADVPESAKSDIDVMAIAIARHWDWVTNWDAIPKSLKAEPKIVLAAIDRKWITTWAAVPKSAKSDIDVMAIAIAPDLDWVTNWDAVPESLKAEPKIVLAAIGREWITTWADVPEGAKSDGGVLLDAMKRDWLSITNWDDVPERAKSHPSIIRWAIDDGLITRTIWVTLPESAKTNPDVVEAGLYKNWYPTWESVPESARGDINVVKAALKEESRKFEVSRDLMSRADEGWEALIPSPAREDFAMVAQGIERHLIRHWRHVPKQLRKDPNVAHRALVVSRRLSASEDDDASEDGEYREGGADADLTPWTWGPEGEQSFNFARDIAEPAASSVRVLTQLILHSRVTWREWAEEIQFQTGISEQKVKEVHRSLLASDLRWKANRNRNPVDDQVVLTASENALLNAFPRRSISERVAHQIHTGTTEYTVWRSYLQRKTTAFNFTVPEIRRMHAHLLGLLPKRRGVSAARGEQ